MSLTLPPLPYALDALEPYVSRLTLSLHHGRHHAGYVEKTHQLVQGTPLEKATLEDIVRASAGKTNQRLFNAAAQAWNHDFYWRSMRPGGGGGPAGAVAKLIRRAFGSQQAFSQAFLKAASEHFASGWAWVVLDTDGIAVVTTHDAETPIVSKQVPLLTIDLWEHAYYPDYQNRRVDYLAACLNHLVNWEFANSNLEASTGSTPSWSATIS